MAKRIKIYKDCRFITDNKTLERAISMLDKTICLTPRSAKLKFSKITGKVGKTMTPEGVEPLFPA